jgi:hypothetical protein
MNIRMAFAAAAVCFTMMAGGAQAAPASAAGTIADAATTAAPMTPVACRSVSKRVCTGGRCTVTKRRVCSNEVTGCRTVRKRECKSGPRGRVCSYVSRRTCN